MRNRDNDFDLSTLTRIRATDASSLSGIRRVWLTIHSICKRWNVKVKPKLSVGHPTRLVYYPFYLKEMERESQAEAIGRESDVSAKSALSARFKKSCSKDSRCLCVKERSACRGRCNLFIVFYCRPRNIGRRFFELL